MSSPGKTAIHRKSFAYILVLVLPDLAHRASRHSVTPRLPFTLVLTKWLPVFGIVLSRRSYPYWASLFSPEHSCATTALVPVDLSFETTPQTALNRVRAPKASPLREMMLALSILLQ
jgi:hypothetical protein